MYIRQPSRVVRKLSDLEALVKQPCARAANHKGHEETYRKNIRIQSLACPGDSAVESRVSFVPLMTFVVQSWLRLVSRSADSGSRLDVDHPRYAELIDQHAEAQGPESL